MDAERFDAFARRASLRHGRRGALLAALAGLGSMATGADARSGPAPSERECRYPGMACAASKTCCARSACVDGRCRCKPALIQCGDFCVTRDEADARGCCKPYKSRCRRSDPLPCCGASSCSGRLEGTRVCCGLEIHPCTTRTQAYCCSGRCGANGRCARPL